MTQAEFNTVMNWAERRLASRIGPGRRAKWWEAFHEAQAERWAGAFAELVKEYRPLTRRRILKALREATPRPLDMLKDAPPYDPVSMEPSTEAPAEP